MDFPFRTKLMFPLPFPQARAWVRAAPCLIAAAFAPAALAQSRPTPSDIGWKAGAVLDASAGSRILALGQRDKGPGLGHSDINLRGPVGPAFQAQFTAVAHTLDRRLETEVEEAWLQTRQLPAGLQLRAGRFASQLGYLNEQHPHPGDFVQRPLLHRAFLGGHWADDGVRLNWTAPTDLYLRVGVEAFGGRRLAEEATAARQPGAVVLSARAGGDWGASQSWQAGLSYLRNARGGSADAHDDDHAGAHDDFHGHGARYTGRRMWLGELAWKWAPQGNNRQQQLRLSLEHAVISGLGPLATAADRHQASYLSAVWRFTPAWEAGLRADLLRVRQVHDDAYEDGRLRETAAMLAYKPSHAQTLRLQLSTQQDRGGFAQASNAVQVQYIHHWGAHAAHAF